ncbi:class I SAM-dependent methyltransferase [Streptomyces sp. NPDC048420]|uniref:class I SAM-dependent methyltransferase n=1 Tax=Streptomyces sp. NPDC048420 TaxID=3155755 RepID=UPI00342A7A8B
MNHVNHVNVGAGTGIAGLAFRARGCRVLGVEPDARMAAFARRHGLAVEVARFEEWEPAGRTFDAVVAGTVWHWVDPVAGADRAARVLRPGGRLALFWNAFQPAPEVAEAFTGAHARALPDLLFVMDWRRTTGPDAYAGVCVTAADGIRRTSAFEEPEEWRFGWDRVSTRESGWTRCPPSAATVSCRPSSWTPCSARSAMPWTRWAGVSPCATRPWRSRRCAPARARR